MEEASDSRAIPFAIASPHPLKLAVVVLYQHGAVPARARGMWLEKKKAKQQATLGFKLTLVTTSRAVRPRLDWY